MAATEAIKEPLWLKCLLHEINELSYLMVVYSNSQSIIHLCNNPVLHEELSILMLNYILLEIYNIN